jgi:hypothetical protein
MLLEKEKLNKMNTLNVSVVCSPLLVIHLLNNQEIIARNNLHGTSGEDQEF